MNSKRPKRTLLMCLFSLSLNVAPISVAKSQELPSAPACAFIQKTQTLITGLSKNGILKTRSGINVKLSNIQLAGEVPKKALEERLFNKEVVVYEGKAAIDRHKRHRAQLAIKTQGANIWLQAELVAKGWAMVSGTPMTRGCLQPLRPYEKAARAAKRGAWAPGGEFKVFQAADLTKLNHITQGTFIIVQGKVKRVFQSNQTTFINFADNWRDDFTLLVKTSLLKRKNMRWPNMDQLPGKKIEVRGWKDHWNGPMIRLDIPEQLEIVEE